MSSLQSIIANTRARIAAPAALTAVWPALRQQLHLWLPILLLMVALSLCFSAWFYRLEKLEEAQMTASAVELTRAQLLNQRSRGPFPLAAQRRAMEARADYLHEVVERLPLRRSELQRVLALEADEHMARLPAIQQLQRVAKESPPTLSLISRPANQGKVFIDRIYHLSKAVEIDLADLSQLLVFLEGATSSKSSAPTGRPLLTITEFKLEEARQPEGRWLLDLQLLEREWRRARAN